MRIDKTKGFVFGMMGFLLLIILCPCCFQRPFDKEAFIKECGFNLDGMRLPLEKERSLVLANNGHENIDNDSLGIRNFFLPKEHPEELSFLENRNLDTCVLCLWMLTDLDYYDGTDNNLLRNHYLSYGLDLAQTVGEVMNIVIAYTNAAWTAGQIDGEKTESIAKMCLPYVARRDKWLSYICRRLILETRQFKEVSPSEAKLFCRYAKKNLKYAERLYGNQSASYKNDYVLYSIFVVLSESDLAESVTDSLLRLNYANISQFTQEPVRLNGSDRPLLWRYRRALEKGDLALADSILSIIGWEVYPQPPFYAEESLKTLVKKQKRLLYGEDYGEGGLISTMFLGDYDGFVGILENFESYFERARLGYLSGDSTYSDLLHHAYIAGASRLFPSSGYERIDSVIRPDYQNDARLYSVLSMQYNHPDPREVYDAALFIKGTGDRIQPVLYRAIHERCSSETIAYADSIRHYGLHGYDGPARTELERKIGYNSPSILLGCLASWDDVRGALDEGEVAIEFIRIPSLECPVSYSYAAAVLKKGYATPQIVRLGTEQDLDALLKSDRYFSSSGYYHYVCKPLEPYLEGATDVFFSMDGLLNLCNINAFHMPDGRLMGDVYRMHLLSSTKELVKGKGSEHDGVVTLFGGLDYASQYDSRSVVNASKPVRQIRSRPIDRKICRGVFAPLPFSEKEVNEIGAFAGQAGLDTIIYKGNDGTEEAFYALDGAARGILHISTHGFYYTKEQAQNKVFFRVYTDEDNPLSRCGLILAHGQNAWNGGEVPAWAEDGILLGSEIAECNLSDVDLVILSACNTALGEISFEGVSGLRQAFKKAGVGSMIVTLSKVDDEGTAFFMRAFYMGLFSGLEKHEAFNQAIAQMRDSDKFNSAKYWTPFVMLD